MSALKRVASPGTSPATRAAIEHRSAGAPGRPALVARHRLERAPKPVRERRVAHPARLAERRVEPAGQRLADRRARQRRVLAQHTPQRAPRALPLGVRGLRFSRRIRGRAARRAP